MEVDSYTGHRRFVYRFGGFQYESLRPGFTLLRFFEDAGIPFRVENVVVYHESLERAAHWIAPVSVGWATAVVNRLGLPRAELWFDRLRVAGLSASQIDDYFTLYTRVLREAVRQLESRAEGVEYSRNQAATSATLLSRLSFRLATGQLRELLSIATELYRKECFRIAPRLHRPLAELFARALHAADWNVLAAEIPVLLSLPIPRYDGFNVALGGDWPEPFNFLNDKAPPHARLDGSAVHPVGANNGLAAPIAWLLGAVEDGNPDARPRGVSRLRFLFDCGALSELQKEKFARALWGRVDSTTRLPEGTGLNYWVLATLPAPEGINAVQLLRDYLASAELPPVTTVDVDGAVTSIGFGGAWRAIDVMTDWIASTAPREFEEDVIRPLIEWSSSEARALLLRLGEWWKTARSLLGALRPPVDQLAADDARKAFDLLPALMRRVILPRIDPLDESSVAEAVRLVEDLHDHGVACLSAMPELLRIAPALESSIADRVRRGLFSNSELTVVDAAESVFRWVDGNVAGRFEGAPAHVLRELVNRVTSRRSPGLDGVLSWTAKIVNRATDLLSDTQIQDLCLGLGDLLSEAVLPTESDRLRFRDPADINEAFAVIAIRVQATRLAAALSRTAETRRWSPDQRSSCASLDRWRVAAEQDPLPEIKAALEDWSDFRSAASAVEALPP